MLKGKKVVMNDKYYVSKKNKGKVFEVVSEPYIVCGTVVVKLNGLAGCYALDGLAWAEEHDKEIRNKTIEDFSQEAVEQFTKFDLEHGYPTVADCKIILQEIAERMKEVGE